MRDELQKHFPGLQVIDGLAADAEVQRFELARDCEEFSTRRDAFFTKLTAAKNGEFDVEFLADIPAVRLLDFTEEELKLRKRLADYLTKLPSLIDGIGQEDRDAKQSAKDAKVKELVDQGYKEKRAKQATSLLPEAKAVVQEDRKSHWAKERVHEAVGENRKQTEVITKRADRVRGKIVGAAL